MFYSRTRAFGELRPGLVEVDRGFARDLRGNLPELGSISSFQRFDSGHLAATRMWPVMQGSATKRAWLER